uniref:Uncharacterized protein n=1 Tax=Arundo donax TaxID=35708 RepID=A0A0A9GB65_ARUDO
MEEIGRHFDSEANQLQTCCISSFFLFLLFLGKVCHCSLGPEERNKF